MKNKLSRLVILLLVLAFISLACCSFFVSDQEEATDVAAIEEEPTEEITVEPTDVIAVEEEPTEEITAQPTEDEASEPEVTVTVTVEEEDIDSDVEFEGKNRSEGGGYAYAAIPNYILIDYHTMVGMMPPDADEDNPTFLFMIGGSMDDMKLEAGNDEVTEFYYELYEFMAADDEGDVDVIEKKEIEVGGYPSQTKLVKTIDDTGMEIFARIIMTEISDTQGFILVAIAPSEHWQDELVPLTDTVINSVEFFEPTTAEFDFDAFNEDISSDTETFDPNQGKPLIRQWASEAYASSEFSRHNWAAEQAIGEPDTLECGDKATAWASKSSYGRDWLELYYEYEVYPTEIHIYQTFNPSQVVLVELLDPSGNYHNVYYGQPAEEEECPYVMTIEIENASYEIMAVEVTVDQSASGLWNEIDAVELIGYTDSDVPDSLLVPTGSNTQDDTDDYAGYTYSPDDVDPGHFIFDISGEISDSGVMMDKSSAGEYNLNLISQDKETMVSLYIPTDISTELIVQEYSPFSAINAPSALVYVDSTPYNAQFGHMMIEIDDNGKTFSGSFSFTAYDIDDEDNVITVDGAFSQFDLELMQ